MAAGTTVTHTRTTTHTIAAGELADYDDIKVTVGVLVTGNDATVPAAAATSASVELAAVATDVAGLAAKVAVTGDGTTTSPEVHTLTATWSGPGSPGLAHRIALYVPVNVTETEWEWLVFPETAPPRNLT